MSARAQPMSAAWEREYTVEPLDHLEPLQRRFEVATGGIVLGKGQRQLTSFVVRINVEVASLDAAYARGNLPR